MTRLGLTTAPTNNRPSYGGKSGPLDNFSSSRNLKSSQKQDSTRPDIYKLSTLIESRISQDSTRETKSPWRENTATPPVPTKDLPKKLSKKHHHDTESEKSLKISSDDEDHLQILVQKSFYITDEERSLASRESPFR
jgi:hypothetical protein